MPYRESFDPERARRAKEARGKTGKAPPNGEAHEEPQEQEGGAPAIELQGFNPADWVNNPEPEDRKWIVKDFILDGTTTPLFGDGGAGKSYLAHQLLVARALGREWIGLLPEPGKTLYLSCEDNLAEMKRRQYNILKFYDAEWKDLGNATQLIDLVGADTVLALMRKGVIEPTPMYHALDSFMAKFKPGLTIIDVLAAVFAGNEIVRTEVRQFANLLNGLCKKHESAILLLAHPSLAGMNSGSGLSGSTDWNNAFRNRAYLETVNGKSDDDGVAEKFRVFRGMKNNYGGPSEKISLEWKNGLYVPVHAKSGVEKIIEDAKVDAEFIKLVKRFNAQDRNAAEKAGSSYAPALFAKEPDNGGFTKEQFEAAMRRLLLAGRIRIEDRGRAGKPARTFIPID